ncbi:hypothetical protein KJZ63_02700 [Patescibacteria group bacterium]|nr:hypothetical protein [Patescibacteria group bacterium]
MKEKLTQLGLVGFGKEVGSQLVREEEAANITVEAEQRSFFIVPQNTTVFRLLNPDLGMTVLSAFYVTKKDNAKVNGGLIKVRVEQEGIEVYRDGQRSVLSKGEILEVPIKRLVKKQRDGV